MKNAHSHLKLHRESSSQQDASHSVALATAERPASERISSIFSLATGWNLHWGPQSAEPQLTQASQSGQMPLAQARQLAQGISALVAENQMLRKEIGRREAELAAGVPVSLRADEQTHLAQRLTSVLQGGAEAIGCHAAALYLLDENTSSLKLRASFGLPEERLLDAPRQLRGAMADLEALVGHAVVLEDTELLAQWKSPENFPSAVCVPVSSPTMPLGTLWIFSENLRDFSDEQTNLVEIVAGRLAADLEREMLLASTVEAKQLDKQVDQAARWQTLRLPSVAPLVEPLEVAGWTNQAEALGGDFFDWSVLADGRLALAVGDAQGKLLEASLSAASVQAALKSHAAYKHSASELLARVNETIWTTSAGDQLASLGYGLIEPESGRLELALAGKVSGLIVRGNRRGITASFPKFESLGTKLAPLGSEPDDRYENIVATLTPGDVLLLLSGGAQLLWEKQTKRPASGNLLAAKIAEVVTSLAAASAQTVSRQLEKFFANLATGRKEDVTALVVKWR